MDSVHTSDHISMETDSEHAENYGVKEMFVIFIVWVNTDEIRSNSVYVCLS